MHWREALIELVHERSFRTQTEIVRVLAEVSGVQLNQATISRELTALGAEKVDGVYRLPPAPDLGAPVYRFMLTANGCLAVVKTDPAYANVIGQAVDAAGLPGVIGTIAGDDTVFIALRDEDGLPALRRILGLQAGATRSAA